MRRTPRPVGTALAVVALVALTGLAGCSSDSGGAAVLPSRSAVVSPTPSTAPSLTTAEIAAEAVAAVRAYFAELNRAVATGDTTALRTMSTETCFCRRLPAEIEKTWRTGSFRGSQFFVPVSLKAHDVFPAVVMVSATYDGREYEVLDKAGRVTKRVPGKRVREDIELVREGVRWIISDIQLLGS